MAKRKDNDYNKGIMLCTSKWTVKLEKLNNSPKIIIGSKTHRGYSFHMLSSRFSNHFYPSTTSYVWVAMCMCNELSMRAFEFFMQEKYNELKA